LKLYTKHLMTWTFEGGQGHIYIYSKAIENKKRDCCQRKEAVSFWINFTHNLYKKLELPPPLLYLLSRIYTTYSVLHKSHESNINDTRYINLFCVWKRVQLCRKQAGYQDLRATRHDTTRYYLKLVTKYRTTLYCKTLVTMYICKLPKVTRSYHVLS